MEVSTLFHRFFFVFCLCVCTSQFTQANAKSTTAKLVAENLIRGLNLFPKQSVNIVSSINQSLLIFDAPSKRFVEWDLKFPQLNGDGPSVAELGHHAGYYKLQNKEDARIFYFFFESRNSSSTAPVVIWLSGGPGCSSELALFYENGPFKINKDLSLKWNDYGWDQASNILFVDQPLGTGFSFASNDGQIPTDEVGVTDDLYDFIQGFFSEHKQFAKNDFYITGESYAGHYVPAFAERVSRGNKAKEGIHINLKGIAIGNGLTDPAIQYAAYPDYALDMKLIVESDYNNIKQNIVPRCLEQIGYCEKNKGDYCLDAFDLCEPIFTKIRSIAGNINHYDVRKQCIGSLCYDFSNIETFLNQQSVRESLGVGDIDFVSCSTTVYDSMLGDFMRDYEGVIPPLLEEGVKVLLYAGEYDLICNWLGNSRWVDAMKWSGQKDFGAAKNVSLVVDGSEAGVMRSYGPLTFLKVHNAGHLVPMDQPKASLQMLSNWMQGTLTKSE